jgi:hypothetical protein
MQLLRDMMELSNKQSLTTESVLLNLVESYITGLTILSELAASPFVPTGTVKSDYSWTKQARTLDDAVDTLQKVLKAMSMIQEMPAGPFRQKHNAHIFQILNRIRGQVQTLTKQQKSNIPVQDEELSPDQFDDQYFPDTGVDDDDQLWDDQDPSASEDLSDTQPLTDREVLEKLFDKLFDENGNIKDDDEPAAIEFDAAPAEQTDQDTPLESEAPLDNVPVGSVDPAVKESVRLTFSQHLIENYISTRKRGFEFWLRLFTDINDDAEEDEYVPFSDVEYYTEQILNITGNEGDPISQEEAVQIASKLATYHN